MSDSATDKQKVRERIQNAVGSFDEQIHRMDISEDAKQSIIDNFNWLLAKSREQSDGETADFLNDQICSLLDLVDSISSGEEEASSPSVEEEHSASVEQGPSPSELPSPANGTSQQDQRGSPKGREWMENGKLSEQTPPANGTSQQDQRGSPKGREWMENGKLSEQTPPANGNGQQDQRGSPKGRNWMENGHLVEREPPVSGEKGEKEERLSATNQAKKSMELTQHDDGQQEEPRRLRARDWMRSAAYPWQDPNHPDPDDVHTQPVRKYTPSLYEDRRCNRTDRPHHNYGRDQLLRLMPDDKPDVILNVPNVSVDLIDFEINNLSARVAVDAAVANDAVRLFVGVDVHLERVKLTIENVQACAQLIVRLDTVRKIVDRALEAIDSDKHPSVLGMTQGLLKR